ncbi:MAG: DUF1987 domain-containing protein [Thermoflexibacter sp.]|jgi:hypothetical protein|nr:DUF1987 domain-containing protein [Thermoflexibacter sp.]
MAITQDVIKLNPTRDTPAVEFNYVDGIMHIKGRCYPSDVKKFFEPLMGWVSEYIQSPIARETTVHIDLEYFNTTSGKFILNIFESLKKLHVNGHGVKVKWYEWESDEFKDDEYSFLDEFEGEYPFVEVIYR